MAHCQVPNRETVARFANFDARYKALQDPHLSIHSQNNQNTVEIRSMEPCHYDMNVSVSNFCKENLGQFNSKSNLNSPHA